jgi:hypothetical protein
MYYTDTYIHVYTYLKRIYTIARTTGSHILTKSHFYHGQYIKYTLIITPINTYTLHTHIYIYIYIYVYIYTHAKRDKSTTLSLSFAIVGAYMLDVCTGFTGQAIVLFF